MLKVLSSLIPLSSLSIGAIAVAASPAQPLDSQQTTTIQAATESSGTPSANLKPANSNPLDPQRPEKICSAKDLSFLEQGLAPKSAEVQTFPQTDMLAVPQQPPAVAIRQVLSLELPTAIRYAFDRNPDLQITKLQLQRSCEQLKQAKAANFPTLTLSSSFSRTDGGSFSPLNRVYSINTADQAQIQQQLREQQSLAQQQLQEQISELQSRFQETSTQVQRETFQQQISQLQQRASLTVLPSPIDFTPFTPGSVSLPLRSNGSSAGGDGGFFNGALNLSYSIFTGGQRSASIQVAERQIETSALSVQLQYQQLRQDVTNRYIDLQQTQSLIAIADSAIASAQETLRTTQLGEQYGIKTKFEVLQAAVTLADAQQNQTQAKALFTIARRQLVQQIGLPDTVDVTLPVTVKAEKAGSWTLPLEETIILALNNRIELTQTKIQRQITELQKRSTKGEKLPQLQGFARINLSDDLEDRFLGAYGYAVGVQANFDIFDGGAVRSRLKQLDQTLKTIDQQFNQNKESIRFEVEQAYSSLQANATNIETANQALRQAQEGLRLAQLRFGAGVGTTLEVTRAQADLTQAQGNQVAAVLDYNRALASLESATGYASPIQR
jgi:outer membrane factor, OMF family